MAYRDSLPDEPQFPGAFPTHDPRTPTRRVEGPSAMSRPWRGADHAGDFLGLDSEIRAHAQGTQAVPQPIVLFEPMALPSSVPMTAAPMYSAPTTSAPTTTAQRMSPQMTAAPMLAPPEPALEPVPSLFDLMQPSEEEIARLAKSTPAPDTSNSWLLGLDDARAGRAGHAPVIADPTRARSAPIPPQLLETSFHEAPPTVQRTGPWLLRILLVAAAASVVFVTYQTFDARRHTLPVALQKPLVPVEGSSSATHETELADPNDFTPSSAREQQGAAKRATKPTTTNRPSTTPTRPNAAKQPANTNPAAANTKSAAKPASSTTSAARPIPTKDSTPRADTVDSSVARDSDAPPTKSVAKKNASNSAPSSTDDAVVPPWWAGSLHTSSLATNESGPLHVDYAGSEERQARMQRWLMIQSRSASPLADTSANRPPIDPAPNDLLAASMLGSTSRDLARKVTESVDSARAHENSAPKLAPTSVVAAIWDGTTVPVEQIDSNARISTPQVGHVRVHLTRGDSVEGRLQAVGQGQLWLDTSIGRIAFGADQVDRIEQIATPSDAVESASANSKTTSTSAAKSDAAPVADSDPKLDPKSANKPAVKPAPTAVTGEPKVADRVRVSTPGGIFYGRIVERDEHTVTLVTDEGAQVTVDATDVEPAPLQKTIVKRDPKGAAKVPAKKTAPKPAPKPAGDDAAGETPKDP